MGKLHFFIAAQIVQVAWPIWHSICWAMWAIWAAIKKYRLSHPEGRLMPTYLSKTFSVMEDIKTSSQSYNLQLTRPHTKLKASQSGDF